MLKHIHLENFKSWRELDIDLAPITLLFGTNSSGKSSVLQALLFLQQSVEKDNINFGDSANDYVYLGSYNDVVFGHDEERFVRIKIDQLNPKQDFEFEMRYEPDHNGITWSGLKKLTALLFNTLPLKGFQYITSLRQYPQRAYLRTGAIPRRIEPNGENTLAALIESDREKRDLHTQVNNSLIQMDLVEDFAVVPLSHDKRFYEPKVTLEGIRSSLLDVGFGVSQVLPVITELFFVPEGSIVLLEQPELHLHPKAQAHLADLFLHVAETRHLQLIVESHSEHLLRRIQRRIAEAETPFATPENIRAYFCQKGENGSTIEQVKVDAFGQISNWPDNFFGDITGDLEAMTFAALQRSRNGH